MNNVKEAINRGFNLLSISIVGLAGFSFMPEIFVEKDMPDKIDDLLLLILAGIAIVWYRKSTNRYVRSLAPVIFILIGLAIKILGFIIELDDKDALGDDIGGLILFILSAGVVLFQYRKTRKLLENQS